MTHVAVGEEVGVDTTSVLLVEELADQIAALAARFPKARVRFGKSQPLAGILTAYVDDEHCVLVCGYTDG
jgi:hypothetical protein